MSRPSLASSGSVCTRSVGYYRRFWRGVRGCLPASRPLASDVRARHNNASSVGLQCEDCVRLRRSRLGWRRDGRVRLSCLVTMAVFRLRRCVKRCLKDVMEEVFPFPFHASPELPSDSDFNFQIFISKYWLMPSLRIQQKHIFLKFVEFWSETFCQNWPWSKLSKQKSTFDWDQH